MQIQQSAVQIQEYRVNLRPVNHGHSMCNACYEGKGRQSTHNNWTVPDILAPTVRCRIYPALQWPMPQGVHCFEGWSGLICTPISIPPGKLAPAHS
jgi:hypothetical protein